MQNKPSYWLSPEADLELVLIARHSRKRWGHGQRDLYMGAMSAFLDTLIDHPNSDRSAPWRDQRCIDASFVGQMGSIIALVVTGNRSFACCMSGEARLWCSGGIA